MSTNRSGGRLVSLAVSRQIPSFAPGYRMGGTADHGSIPHHERFKVIHCSRVRKRQSRCGFHLLLQRNRAYPLIQAEHGFGSQDEESQRGAADAAEKEFVGERQRVAVEQPCHHQRNAQSVQ